MEWYKMSISEGEGYTETETRRIVLAFRGAMSVHKEFMALCDMCDELTKKSCNLSDKESTCLVAKKSVTLTADAKKVDVHSEKC